MPEMEKERVLYVGPDRVTVTDYEMVIEAKHEMPEWEVLNFNPVPVYFQDNKLFLAEKGKAERPYAVIMSNKLPQPTPMNHEHAIGWPSRFPTSLD